MSPAPSPGILLDSSAIGRHLQLLGKDPATVRLRAFAHKDNPRKWHAKTCPDGIKARKTQGLDVQSLALWQREQRNLYLVVNDGGDKKASITSCRAFWLEWDDREKAWQLKAWQELGLPRPTFIIDTGGKSLHCYWVLSQPIAPEVWAPIQSRLIDHAGADQAVKDPSRVLRLAGSAYIGPDGLPQDRASFIEAHGTRYTAEQIAAALPPEPMLTPPAATSGSLPAPAPSITGRPPLVLDDGTRPDQPARSLDQIRQALDRIPPYASGRGQRREFIRFAGGLRAAVKDAGGSDDTALELALAHSPGVHDLADYWLSEWTEIDAGSFWWIADQHGYDLRAHTSITPAAPRQAASPAPARFTPRPDTSARWGFVKLGLRRRMEHFAHCIHSLVQSERNSIRRIARVRHAHAALELKTAINQKEIGQLILEAIDERTGNRFAALSAADRQAMPIPMVEWEVPGCIPRRDLTIIGGRAKVGKTRLANALVAALLKGQDFLGFGTAPDPRTVILVTDDQGDGDTAQMLQQLGLWDHPRLLWSRRFRVTESNIDALLQAITDNPGAIVILDSLRSITRSNAFGENDPEMGSLIYDLKQQVVDASGTLLLIHHCNKSNDSTGTEALSGHNAIAGAANTILTLHYLSKGPRLLKDSPQRRLVREARSGPPADLVVEFVADSGGFDRIGDYEAITEAAEEAAGAAADIEAAIRSEAQDVKEALRFLQAYRLSADNRPPGLMDICHAIGVAPMDAQRKADLEGQALTTYKRIGRVLSGRLASVVVSEKHPTSGSGFFITYRLTDDGADLVARIFGL